MPIRTFLLDMAGLDLRGLIGSPDTALMDNCENVMISPDGDLVGRRGYQAKAKAVGGYGLFRHVYVNSDGTLENEILTVDESLHKLNTGSIDISYTGSSTHIVVTILVESGNIRLKVIEAGTVLLNRNLGKGYEESSSDTISATVAAIDALSGITCTMTGSNVSSAFLDITPSLRITKNRSGTIYYNYFTDVYSNLPSPFLAMLEKRTTSSLTNVRQVSHQNLSFFADGGPLKVYDGQSLYKAGLPKPPIPQHFLVSGDQSRVVTYNISYEHTDARGKRTESPLSDDLAIILSKQAATLNIKTVEESSGYNTNCAIVNGSQTLEPGTMTITVNSGHTIRAGDTVTFLNRFSRINDIVAYEITSITTTTITFDCPTDLVVTDDDVISAGLLINIYRSTNADNAKYLIKQLPNNSTVGSIEYTDAPGRAVVRGTQYRFPEDGIVAISIDSGSTLQEGQLVEFFNSEENIYTTVAIEVLGVTSTEVLLRTDLPMAILDDEVLLVSDLNFPIFTEYLKTQGSPPDVVESVASYKGNLIVTNSSRVYYSDDINNGAITSSQSFPPTHYIQLYAPCKGVVPLGDWLYVFTTLGIECIISSALDVAPYNKILVSDQIICSSLESCIAVTDSLYFMSQGGVYRLSKGQLDPTALSAPISQFFRSLPVEYNLERSVGFHDLQEKRLMWYVPYENQSNTDFGTSESLTIIYDYERRTWFYWKNWNMAGGALMDEKNVYFSERYSKNSLRRNLNRELKTRTSYDYLDHTSTISVWAAFKWTVLDSGALGLQKRLHSISLFQKPIQRDPPNSYPTMNVKVYRDLVDNLVSTSSSITYDEPGNKWNDFLWNDQPIGSWQKAHKKIKAVAQVVESVKIWVGAELNAQNFNLTAIEFDWDYLDLKQLKT